VNQRKLAAPTEIVMRIEMTEKIFPARNRGLAESGRKKEARVMKPERRTEAIREIREIRGKLNLELRDWGKSGPVRKKNIKERETIVAVPRGRMADSTRLGENQREIRLARTRRKIGMVKGVLVRETLLAARVWMIQRVMAKMVTARRRMFLGQSEGSAKRESQRSGGRKKKRTAMTRVARFRGLVMIINRLDDFNRNEKREEVSRIWNLKYGLLTAVVGGDQIQVKDIGKGGQELAEIKDADV
jgi:hypothetical protein